MDAAQEDEMGLEIRKSRRSLRAVAPRAWSWEMTLEAAREAAALIFGQRESGCSDPDTGAVEIVREYDADAWSAAKGIAESRSRSRRLAVMRRAEALAQHHESQGFDLVGDALRQIGDAG